MTTTVIIRTHDWPAEVRTFPLLERSPLADGAWSDPSRVEPNSEREFVVHDGQDIMVRELPIDSPAD